MSFQEQLLWDLKTALTILDPCVGMMNSIIAQADERDNPDALASMKNDVRRVEKLLTKYAPLMRNRKIGVMQ